MIVYFGHKKAGEFLLFSRYASDVKKMKNHAEFNEPIDLAELRDMTGVEETDLLLEVLLSLIDSTRAQVAEINTHFTTNEFVLLKKSVHCAKGGALQAAAFPLAEMLRDLENLIENGSREAIAAKIKEIEKEQIRLMLFVNDFRSEHDI